MHLKQVMADISKKKLKELLKLGSIIIAFI